VLDAPTFVWLGLLLLGLVFFAVALAGGQPSSGEGSSGGSPSPSAVSAEGGSGGGDLRGNVFGDNATVNVSPPSAKTDDRLAGKHRTRRTPVELMAIYEGRTDVQARKLLEPHLDSWMRLKGSVINVSERASGGHLVWVTLEDGLTAVLAFDDAETQVLTLDIDDPIEFIGRLTNVVKDSYLDFEDCAFVA
jgi:hypothetical protein